MKSLLTSTGLSVLIDGKPYILPKHHENYPKAIEAYKSGDEEWLKAVLEEALYLKKEQAVKYGIELVGDKVYKNGVELHNAITRRISEFSKNVLPFEYLFKFLERIEENTSFNSKQELFDFLDKENLPIDEEGYFYAYKAVQSDYYSKYSGTIELIQGKTKNGKIYNGIGEIIECKRSDVNDNINVGCSYGLHVGSLEYSGPNGFYHNSRDRILIVKVDPKDVVAVPREGSFHKVRCCKYEVVEEYVNPLGNTVYGHNSVTHHEDCCEYCDNPCCTCYDDEYDDEYDYCDHCNDDYEDCSCGEY